MRYLLCFLCLVATLPRVAKADSVMGFEYDDVTACSSTVVEMNSLAFDCNSDNGCTTGDEVTMTGQFTTTLPIAEEVNIKIQVCKFWGNLCSTYLVDQDVNICDLLDSDGDGGDNNNGDDAVDDDVYCASAGTYDYQTDFALPESSLADNFAVNGVTFRIYVLINNEFTCHAEFTTVKSDASYDASMGYSMLGFTALLLSGFSVHEVGKRRRRTRAQVDLRAEEGRQQQPESKRVDFDAMHDHYVTL